MLTVGGGGNNLARVKPFQITLHRVGTFSFQLSTDDPL